MNRRDFSKHVLMLGIGAGAGLAKGNEARAKNKIGNYYEEPPNKLPIRKFDVVVAGAGTAGVVAALAAARQGAKTILIERKGYTGGTATEGGTALHSFYNLWQTFDVEKRQVVRGIPQEIIDRLMKVGGCTGHAEMSKGFDFDSVCTAIDTELYKLVTMQMLDEAGVFIAVNTLLTGAVTDGSRVRGAIVDSRSGREAIYAKAFVDCTAYGDLAAFAGADYKEPNDYACCNSVGIGNVDIDTYHEFIRANGQPSQIAMGIRSGEPGKVVRVQGPLGPEFAAEARKIGMSSVTTTVHDNYFMFIKCNYKVPGSVMNRDDMAKAELEVRKRMARAVELFRKYVPGCEKAFMARTSPTLCIRRGRLITCDYDITHEDVIEGRHFDDDVMAYGFHDSAPRFQVKDGGTYGIPYKALRVAGIDNLLVAGMMITSDRRAHMSTRNTVSCMGQGQATGTAAALCSAKNCGTRELRYAHLRDALKKASVYFEA
ncbi:MAG: FAD-dependent oxidoreductase [Planctomycetes bacterium]|nr:FAD-dependent oxidoreductase [Planctomycetota bacterium]